MNHVQSIEQHLAARLDDYLTDLAALVALDSYSHDPDDVNRVNDWLERRLLQMGFTVTRHPQPAHGDNLTATRRGSGRGKILLLGHSDTVYPRGTPRQRPLTVNGEKVLGPGAYDMKGGLLTGIYAVEALSADAYEQITFLVVSDEEINQRPSVPLIRETIRGHDAALTLEGARENGDIVTARKGILSVTVTAAGKAAHAGVEPEKGRNAITGLVGRLPALVALNDPAAGISVNVGTIAGGVLPNVVPEHAQTQVDVRAFHQSQLDTLREQIAAIFAHPADGVQFSVQFIDVSPPMARTPAIASLEALAQRAANEIGFHVNGASTGGAADAAFAAAEGVAVLDGLGPVGGLDHSPDEYILKDSIVPRTAMLARLIELITEQPT